MTFPHTAEIWTGAQCKNVVTSHVDVKLKEISMRIYLERTEVVRTGFACKYMVQIWYMM